MRAPRLHTIYLRLVLPFTVALLVGTTAAWWLGTALLARVLEDRVAEQLRHAAQTISERSFPITEDVLERMRRLLPARLHIFDAAGRMQLGPGVDYAPELLAELDSRYRVWHEAGEEFAELRFDIGTLDYLMVFRRLDPALQPRYAAVVVFTDLADVRLATRRGAWLLGLAALAGVLLLAGIGHAIARTITVPLAGLAAMAGRIAGGDRNARATVYRRDEIGALADALNAMAGKLALYEARVAETSRKATLGELAARVAHEIRNPLTAIKMHLELLADSVEGQDHARCMRVLAEIRRLELIVASTLELGRPQALHRQSVQLDELVDELLTLMTPQFRHRRIELQNVRGSALPLLQIDSDRIKQVLLNLLTNAADALPGGGVVRVTTRLLPGAVVALEVEDSGAGIDDKRKAAIFLGEGSSKPTGLGLGLQVVRQLIELHGGSVEILDSALGGASFRILLPVES